MSHLNYTPLPVYGCSCTHPKCLHVIADLKLAQLSPRQAINEAKKESATSPLVLKIANKILTDGRYRRSGASTMFIKHILEGKPTDDADGKTPWDYGVLGLLNIFASIKAAGSSFRDAGIKREMYNAYGKIIEVIRNDLDFLSGSGIMSENRRAIICTLLGYYALDSTMKRAMYEERTLHIALHCWLYSPPSEHTDPKITTMPIEVLFHPHPASGPEPPSGYLKIAFRSYGVDLFVSQVICRLKNKKFLGVPLENEFRSMGYFIHAVSDPTFLPLVRSRIHRHIVHAMRRQTRNSDIGGHHNVLREGANVLFDIIVVAENGMEIYTDLLANTCLTELTIVAFNTSSTGCSCTSDTYYDLFMKILHGASCEESDCHYRHTPAFLEAARASLERVPLKSILALQKDTNLEPKYFGLFQELIKLLDVTPESIWDRYRIEKRCCNMDCPSRLAGLRPQKKYTCEGCLCVWYCDADCQKSDWEHHKTECKLFAEESMMDFPDLPELPGLETTCS